MRLLGMNPTEAEVQAAMESVDENKNGKLEHLGCYKWLGKLLAARVEGDSASRPQVRD